jgi:hypothetical protein
MASHNRPLPDGDLIPAEPAGSESSPWPDLKRADEPERTSVFLRIGAGGGYQYDGRPRRARCNQLAARGPVVCWPCARATPHVLPRGSNVVDMVRELVSYSARGLGLAQMWHADFSQPPFEGRW